MTDVVQDRTLLEVCTHCSKPLGDHFGSAADNAWCVKGQPLGPFFLGSGEFAAADSIE